MKPNHLNTVNFIETSSFRITKRKDGIVHTHLKSELEWKMEQSIDLYNSRQKISNGEKILALCTCVKFVIPTNEVRKFTASKERSKHIIGDAYVINSLPQKLIANFYIRFNKPSCPTKIFSEKSKAINWLLSL